MTIETSPSKPAFLPKRGLRVVWGFVLLMVGAVLAIPGVPGPGIPIVLLGLWLLSDRYTWAKRAFDWIKGKADRFRRAPAEERQAAAQMVNEVPAQK